MFLLYSPRIFFSNNEVVNNEDKRLIKYKYRGNNFFLFRKM